MTLDEIYTSAIKPALEIMAVADKPEATVMLLTIGLQESRFQYRKQMGDGPARSFWQFEKNGGVKGVLNHPASKSKAVALCNARGVTPDPFYAWQAMETDDVLGAGFARLLLLTDPRALPIIDDADGSWLCYVKNWRPGKPHPETWVKLHNQAVAYVQGAK